MNHMMQHEHQLMSKSQTGHDTSVMHASHDRHAGHSVAMFRDKFWLSFILTVPVLFWSTDVQRWFGYTAPSFPGSRFIPAILGTVVFFLWRTCLHPRGMGRTCRSQARHDDSHQHG